MAKKPIFGLGKYGILQISKPDFGIEQDYGITEFGFGFAFPRQKISALGNLKAHNVVIKLMNYSVIIAS